MARHHDTMFKAAERSLGDLVTDLSTRIQEAAGRQDFSAVAAFTKAATAITSFAKGVAEESEKLGLLDDQVADRTFLIRISAGALRNSYLSVTDGINRGWLKPGQSVQIRLPDGEEFNTTVMQANRLQERGRVSEFYSTRQVTAGDYVELSEMQAGVWLLSALDINPTPMNFKREGKTMITGDRLNEKYKIGAAQARYRENGVWYHPLDQFPGVLFDAKGYAFFKTASEYAACDSVKKGPDPNHIHVKGGISSLPFYVPLDPAPSEIG